MKIIGTARTDIPPYRDNEPVQLIASFVFDGVERFVAGYVLNDRGDWDFVVRTAAQMRDVKITHRSQNRLD